MRYTWLIPTSTQIIDIRSIYLDYYTIIEEILHNNRSEKPEIIEFNEMLNRQKKSLDK